MELSAFDLSGKVALITGGAHGIGFSIAEGMARCGATICFNCSSQSSYEKGMAAYQAAGIEAHGYVADVTDWDAVSAMVDKIAAEVGPVDILVNNAGIIQRKPMLETSSEDFERVIKVHVVGAFNCSKAVLPAMIEKRAGKIINICSMMSELGRETVSGYAAAKGGLKMLTKNIASEFGQYNIQCNGMGPGYIATPQTAPLRERLRLRQRADPLRRRRHPGLPGPPAGLNGFLLLPLFEKSGAKTFQSSPALSVQGIILAFRVCLY